MQRDNTITFDVWGDKGAFTRPELQAERLTYPYITPSAARNIAQAIYWHPGLEYTVEKIEILSPIKTASIMRRERTDVITPKIGAKTPVKSNLYTLRSTEFLKKPYYRITFSYKITKEGFEKDLNYKKVRSIFEERLKKGKCFTRPYLGFREFVAEVGPVDPTRTIPQELTGKEICEFMTYDFDYNKTTGLRTPSYYMSHMKDGVIDLKGVKIFR